MHSLVEPVQNNGVEKMSSLLVVQNIEAHSSDVSQLLPQHKYKLDVHSLNTHHPGEFECREFRESILGVMPHRWDRREDTLLMLAHLRLHQRKTLKRSPGKTINYPSHKPEENHPPCKDSTKKISNIIGKAANYAGSVKLKKPDGPPAYKRIKLVKTLASTFSQEPKKIRVGG